MKRYPAYKPSGIDWLGDIPEGWEVKRLKHACKLITEKSEEENKKIGLENISSKTAQFIETHSEFVGTGIKFIPDDILFGKLRPYLAKVYKAEFDGSAIGDFFVYRAFENIDPNFIKYRLISDLYISVLNGSTYGAKMPRVSSEFMNNIIFPTPPLPEQQQIASFLDKKTAQIDTLIEKKQKMMELLKEKRAAIINRAVTRGLDPNVKLKPSGIDWLGDIPEGWEVKPLKYSSTIVLGKMLTKKDNGRSLLKPYLRSINVQWETVDISDIKSMWFSQADLLKYRLNKNDLLLNEGGEVGRTAIWQNDIEECYIQNSVHKVSIKPSNDHKYFFYLSINYGSGGYYDAIVDRVSIPHLTREKLKSVHFLTPPLPEQKQIAAFLDKKTAQIDTFVEITNKQIELLKEYRTTLISDVVTGKVDVRDEVTA